MTSRACLAAACALAAAFAAAAVDAEAVARLKSLPGPMQSADGALYVACQTPARADLRWPVLQFADGVRDNLSDAFVPLGDKASPLLIVLGAETNRVAGVTRRSMGTPDGFSQLIIHVPNPDTVDLEQLRERIAEALLRERARGLSGSYAALKWPPWFIRAAVDASRGNLWRAEAYERAHDLLGRGAFPALGDFFAPGAEPPREPAAFFALWVFERNGAKAKREALLTAPWEPLHVVGGADDAAWQAWFRAKEDTVFVPGTLTRSQFHRWADGLAEPKDAAEAARLCEWLTRQSIGRPQVFRDLTELYLRAYAAFVTGDVAAYAARRAEADEARGLLEQTLSVTPLIQDTPPAKAPAP